MLVTIQREIIAGVMVSDEIVPERLGSCPRPPIRLSEAANRT